MDKFREAYRYSALVQQLNFGIIDPGYPKDFHRPGERVSIRGDYRLVDRNGNYISFYEDLLEGSTFPPTRYKEMFFVLAEEKAVNKTSFSEM